MARIAFFIIIVWQSFLSATLLHDAAKNGDLDSVKKLLANGASFNEQDFRFINGGQTPLMVAACHGHLLVVKELLTAGAEVHARDNRSWTALKYAVSGGSTAIVLELLNAKADVNAMTEHIQYIKPCFVIEPTSVLMSASGWWKFGIMRTIRRWLIENQIRITNAQDIKILDGWLSGSYQRDFAAYQKKM